MHCYRDVLWLSARGDYRIMPAGQWLNGRKIAKLGDLAAKVSDHGPGWLRGRLPDLPDDLLRVIEGMSLARSRALAEVGAFKIDKEQHEQIDALIADLG